MALTAALHYAPWIPTTAFQAARFGIEAIPLALSLNRKVSFTNKLPTLNFVHTFISSWGLGFGSNFLFRLEKYINGGEFPYQEALSYQPLDNSQLPRSGTLLDSAVSSALSPTTLSTPFIAVDWTGVEQVISSSISPSYSEETIKLATQLRELEINLFSITDSIKGTREQLTKALAERDEISNALDVIQAYAGGNPPEPTLLATTSSALGNTVQFFSSYDPPSAVSQAPLAASAATGARAAAAASTSLSHSGSKEASEAFINFNYKMLAYLGNLEDESIDLSQIFPYKDSSTDDFIAFSNTALQFAERLLDEGRAGESAGQVDRVVEAAMALIEVAKNALERGDIKVFNTLGEKFLELEKLTPEGYGKFSSVSNAMETYKKTIQQKVIKYYELLLAKSISETHSLNLELQAKLPVTSANDIHKKISKLKADPKLKPHLKSDANVKVTTDRDTHLKSELADTVDSKPTPSILSRIANVADWLLLGWSTYSFFKEQGEMNQEIRTIEPSIRA